MTSDAARILVAVDFDPASADAVALAGRLAEALHARLTVFHAVAADLPAYFTMAQAASLESERLEARRAGAAEAGAFAARATQASFSVLTDEGPAADAILRQAPAFDVVVLGTNGRGGLRRWWLGSVAEAVVKAAPVPVLVAAPPHTGDRAQPEELLVVGAGDAPAHPLALTVASALRLEPVAAPALAVATLKESASPLLFLPAAADVREGGRHDG